MILSLALAAHVSLSGLADQADLRSGPAVLLPSRAVVTQKAEATGPSEAKRPAAEESKDEKGRKVIRIEELTIEGRIQKPQAFYILQRSQLNFDELNRTESFIPRVEKSVENAPF